MELFGRIYRVVEPKRQRLDAAMEQLKEKQASLAEAQRKLAEVTEKMENLKKQVSYRRQISNQSYSILLFVEIRLCGISRVVVIIECCFSMKKD